MPTAPVVLTPPHPSTGEFPRLPPLFPLVFVRLIAGSSFYTSAFNKFLHLISIYCIDMAAHMDQTAAHYPPIARPSVHGRDIAFDRHRSIPFTNPGSLSEAHNGTISVPLVDVLAVPHPTFYYPDGDVSFIVGLLCVYRPKKLYSIDSSLYRRKIRYSKSIMLLSKPERKICLALPSSIRMDQTKDFLSTLSGLR